MSQERRHQVEQKVHVAEANTEIVLNSGTETENVLNRKVDEVGIVCMYY
jgi:hypothetical protein